MTTPTKVLDLRGLSATERDTRVNEAVAVMLGLPNPRRIVDHSGLHVEYGIYPDTIRANFATSCDAVREIEQKLDHRNAVEYAFKLSVVVGMDENSDTPWDEIFKITTASALDRCIALLRANGWEVLT